MICLRLTSTSISCLVSISMNLPECCWQCEAKVSRGRLWCFRCSYALFLSCFNLFWGRLLTWVDLFSFLHTLLSIPKYQFVYTGSWVFVERVCCVKTPRAPQGQCQGAGLALQRLGAAPASTSTGKQGSFPSAVTWFCFRVWGKEWHSTLVDSSFICVICWFSISW